MTALTITHDVALDAQHGEWRAVRRVPRGGSDDATRIAESLLETLLEAVTAPGADRFQRRDDLEAIARLVETHPQIGYGVAPIDLDEHPSDCLVCQGSMDPVVLRDGHAYTVA